MKKNIYFMPVLAISLLLLFTNGSNAQQQVRKKSSAIHNEADSLMKIFKNTVYKTIYSSEYWKQTVAPLFTVLKIDFDDFGKLKKIEFSDSADTLFVNDFFKGTSVAANKAVLEKYANSKAYQAGSILIPISYRSTNNSNRGIDYNHAESLWLFHKKDFVGKSILLSPIDITLSSN